MHRVLDEQGRPFSMGRAGAAGALVLLMLASTMAGCLGTGGEDVALDAVFTFSPASNINEGEVVFFDASGSLPSDGSLTYRWDFDGDGAVDEIGRTAEWRFTSIGDALVTLTITDGVRNAEATRTITVYEATAEPPVASITTYSSDWDCFGEDAKTGSFILVWLCEDDKDLSDRRIEASASVLLDATDSTAGSSDDWITSWAWDLDPSEDSDGDGDPENDADLEGEEVEWQNVMPGEYEIVLTVVSGKGMSEKDDTKVYVNYVGTWLDFEIGGNSTSGAAEITFDMPVVYDRDSGNTISKAVGHITYPKQDDDWVPGTGNQNNNRLELYVYDEDDDEVLNSSSIGDDQRSDGDDCNDGDEYCLDLPVSSYQMGESTHGDGEWTITIHNDRWNDIQVDRFRIVLYYKT
jgi:hypothetical protein